MNGNSHKDIIDDVSQKLLKIDKNHQDYFLSIIEILKSNPDILGVLLGGSLSREKADHYSDVDLFCLCKPDRQNALKTNLLERFRNIEVIEQVIEQGSFGWLGETLTLYFACERYFSIDIGLIEFSKSAQFFWEPTGVILWDFDNMIVIGKNTSVQLQGYKKFPFATQSPLRHSVILLRKIKKNLLRNHLWNCIEYITKLRRNLIFLIRIHIVHKDDFLGNPERDIEGVLPLVMIERLNKTQPGMNQTNIAEATFLLVDWLVEIVDETIVEHETNNQEMAVWILKELSESKEWFLNFVNHSNSLV